VRLTAEQEIALHARFPHAFLLRDFPGETFRVSCADSYMNDNAVLMIYTQRWDVKEQTWLDFAKGTAEELSCEIVPSRTTTVGTLEPIVSKNPHHKLGQRCSSCGQAWPCSFQKGSL